MDIFWKAIAGALVASVLVLTVDKRSIGLALTITVCAMTGAAAISYLAPVKTLLMELQALAGLQGGLLEILLKSAGIALTAELSGVICQDAGLGSLAKTIQLLGNALILYLSIPAFQALLTVLRDILGEL